MNVDRGKMISSLTQKVIPELRRLNFKGSFPHFRRTASDRINILTFQFDKNGGGFVIEVANCRLEGYITPWGKEIKPNKITTYDLKLRARIYSDTASGDTSIDNWYRYDRTSLKEVIDIYASVSDEVLNNLSFAQCYWLNGEIN